MNSTKHHNASFIKYSALAFLVLLLPILVFSQQLTLSRQLVPKEVSKNKVYTILQDSNGFIWYGGSGLYKYDGYHSESINLSGNDSTLVGLSTVYALLEDKKGRIWIGSTNGLFCYDQETDQIRRFLNDKLTNRHGKLSTIMSLYEDSAGGIWIGGEDKLFVIPDLETEVIQSFAGLGTDLSNATLDEGVKSILENRAGIFAASTNGLWKLENGFKITQHVPDEFAASSLGFRIDDAAWGKGDTLWLATPEGLWIFETGNSRFSKVMIPEYTNKTVRGLLVDEENQLWIATKDELFLRHLNGNFRRIGGKTHLLFDGLKVLFKDRYGNIWLGGHHGAGMLDINQDKRLPFYQVGYDSPYHDNHFYRIMQDSFGGFWFRMFRTGLGYCSALEEEFKILLQPTVHYFSEEIKGLCSDADSNVWVITYTNGLYLFEKGREQYRHIDLGDSLRRVAIPAAIITDNKDDRLLWFSSRVGLCSVDRFTYQRKWYHPKTDLPWLDTDGIGMIGQDDDGNIWCALKAKGGRIVGYFDKSTRKFNAEQDLSDRPEVSQIYQFKPVTEGKLWVATNNGVVIIDYQQKTQSFWLEKNGFPTNNPLSIMPDKHGNIWFTSDHKIYKYDGQGFEWFNANEEIERFDNTSSALTKEGLIAFGGVNGMHVFDPEKIEKDTIPPKVYLTNFLVFNKKRKLSQAFELVNEITLPFEDNVFTLEFAGLHYAHSKSIDYRYKLEGFQKEWVSTQSGNRKATYTNLAPGNYTFKALAVNADGYWTSDTDALTVQLTILPPWYRTDWAYLLWALLFFGGLYFLYKFQLNRRLAEAEARRLKELDHAKSLLYTNITHEFRTPLTIILGMADQIKNDPKNWFSEGIQLITRNGKQLLTLVNQLLDLSKLESGHMPLKLKNGDIVSFLQYLTESFHSFADCKDIRIHFLSEYAELYMDFDSDKLQQVVSNLLSNAIKFTPAGGNVYVDFRMAKSIEPYVQLQIKDDGIGIAAEHLPHIFDRFYQIDATHTRKGEGAGIGLALVKELVKAMKGSIEVKSHAREKNGNQGTKFSIQLPFTQTAKPAAKHSYPKLPSIINDTFLLDKNEQQGVAELPKNEQHMVLLIEDNKDVLTYLTSFLSNDYRIVTAQDGQEGIDKALELIPDLIVSDVMMPEKDGFEVCTALKSNEQTNHIPIILLTAKSDQDSKIEGLTYGADTYLAKPFNREELMIRMEKLISTRQQLQKRFQQAGSLRKITQKPVPTKEEAFMQKVIHVVEGNLNDENFGMPQLCKELLMSRSHLFRKLKAITGKSATHLIRSIRLEKGKELLETTQLNVSEVCFEVGFNNPNYFARSFQEEFGVSPSTVKNH